VARTIAYLKGCSTWVRSNGGMLISRGKPKRFEETPCFSATSSNTNLIWSQPGLNLWICDEMSGPNRLSYGTAYWMIRTETRCSVRTPKYV
jgi:hypothetical protein